MTEKLSIPFKGHKFTFEPGTTEEQAMAVIAAWDEQNTFVPEREDQTQFDRGRRGRNAARQGAPTMGEEPVDTALSLPLGITPENPVTRSLARGITGMGARAASIGRGFEGLVASGLEKIGAEESAASIRDYLKPGEEEYKKYQTTAAAQSPEALVGGVLADVMSFWVPGAKAEAGVNALLRLKDVPRAYKNLAQAVQTYGQASPEAVAAARAIKFSDRAKKFARPIPGEIAAGGLIGAAQEGEDELMQGAAGAGLNTAIGRGVALATPVVGAVKRAVQGAVTKEGAERIAGNELLERSSGAVDETTPPIFGEELTLGQQTGDKSLLALEKKISNVPEEIDFRDTLARRKEQAEESIAAKLKQEPTEGTPGDVYEIENVLTRAAQAKGAAAREDLKLLEGQDFEGIKDRFENIILPPEISSAEEVSRNVAQLGVKKYQEAHKAQKDAWRHVPNDEEMSIRQLRRDLKKIKNESLQSDKKYFPQETYDDTFALRKEEINSGKLTKFKEYKGVYSDLKDRIRSESTKIEKNLEGASPKKLTSLMTAKKAIEAHMDMFEKTSPAYKAASAATRSFYSKFREKRFNIYGKVVKQPKASSAGDEFLQGADDEIDDIGAFFGDDAVKASKQEDDVFQNVEPTEFLDNVFKSKEHVDFFRTTVDDDPQAIKALHDYALAKVDSTLTTGKTTSSWEKSNRDILASIPGAAQQVQNRLATVESIRTAIKAKKIEIEKELEQDPLFVRQKLFQDKTPTEAVLKILQGKNAAKQVEELRTFTASNPQAKAGLEELIVDELVKSLASGKTSIGSNNIRELSLSIYKSPEQRTLLLKAEETLKRLRAHESKDIKVGRALSPSIRTKVEKAPNMLAAWAFPYLSSAYRVFRQAKVYDNTVDNISDIVKEGLLNPEFGKMLIEKASKEKVSSLLKEYKKIKAAQRIVVPIGASMMADTP